MRSGPNSRDPLPPSAVLAATTTTFLLLSVGGHARTPSAYATTFFGRKRTHCFQTEKRLEVEPAPLNICILSSHVRVGGRDRAPPISTVRASPF